jgi:hypothetical protein
MQADRPLVLARVSAEASISARLDEVSRWLIERHAQPVRLDLHTVSAIGQDCWLWLTRPITAPRTVLSSLRLFEDMDSGECLVAGQVRFVAHPTESRIKMSFNGGTAMVLRRGQLHRQADHAARQLLSVIAESIEGGPFTRAALVF